MMENKFTPRAEESLRLAQEAAEEMGHGYVGSEHLLLGLLQDRECAACRLMAGQGDWQPFWGARNSPPAPSDPGNRSAAPIPACWTSAPGT